MECRVAGTTTQDRECEVLTGKICHFLTSICSYSSPFPMNESYGSVNSHGRWACANILTTLTKSVTGLYLFWISPDTVMNDDVHVLIK